MIDQEALPVLLAILDDLQVSESLVDCFARGRGLTLQQLSIGSHLGFVTPKLAIRLLLERYGADGSGLSDDEVDVALALSDQVDWVQDVLERNLPADWSSGAYDSEVWLATMEAAFLQGWDRLPEAHLHLDWLLLYWGEAGQRDRDIIRPGLRDRVFYGWKAIDRIRERLERLLIERHPQAVDCLAAQGG